MTDKEYQLSQDFIELMLKYGAVGMVLTMYLSDQDGFTTMRLVQPGYNQTPFKEVENGLAELVHKVFGAKEHNREEGYVVPKNPNNEMPH